jgi:hypothetical protein
MGKKRIAGTVLLIIGIIGVVLGIIGAIALPIFAVMMERDASEFDDWVADAQNGDEEDFSGTIAEKKGFLIYEYRFEEADEWFYCGEGDMEEGDLVILTIEMTEIGPEATSQLSYELCIIPGGICAAVFLVLLITGIILMVVGKKEDRQAKQQAQAPPGYIPPHPQQGYGNRPYGGQPGMFQQGPPPRGGGGGQWGGPPGEFDQGPPPRRGW